MRQAAAHSGGEHEHLVHADGHGRVVAEDGHRGGVADEDHVDPGLLDDLRGGVVVGRDHHDRLAGLLHLAELGSVTGLRSRGLGSEVACS